MLVEKPPQVDKWKARQWRGKGNISHGQAGKALSLNIVPVIEVLLYRFISLLGQYYFQHLTPFVLVLGVNI